MDGAPVVEKNDTPRPQQRRVVVGSDRHIKMLVVVTHHSCALDVVQDLVLETIYR